MMEIEIIPRTLHFKQPAGTSRGVYTTHNVWYLAISENGKTGYGECAPLSQLSCDDVPDYETKLQQACRETIKENKIPYEMLRDYPSILFGLESAMQYLETNSPRLWDTPFSRGEAGIPINGLIWMGSKEKMLQQIEKKMSVGFRCIKLKIGAINFEDELSLLSYIRKHYSSKDIELRVDANGAFSPQEALKNLEKLAALDIHSIEQPIRAGQWKEMAELCSSTPLPIALDEELIGLNTDEKKQQMLNEIHPQYIILKPTLHGAICGVKTWIKEAESLNIGWWITSALESNVGLNAIAQFCATLHPSMPQGLGTGMLFTDNVDFPLEIRKDCLWYDIEKEKKWKLALTNKY